MKAIYFCAKLFTEGNISPKKEGFMKRYLLAVLPALSFAVEPSAQHFDLRLGVGVVPGINEASGNNNDEDDYSKASGGRVSIEGVYSDRGSNGMGMFVGPGIYAVAHQAENNSIDFASGVLDYKEKTTLSALAVGLQGGVLFAPNELYQLDIGARGLIGQSKAKSDLDLDSSLFGRYSVDHESDTGSYWDVDIFIGNHLTFAGGVQLGLEVGYSIWEAKNTFNDTNQEVTWSGKGLEAAITIGYRF